MRRWKSVFELSLTSHCYPEESLITRPIAPGSRPDRAQAWSKDTAVCVSRRLQGCTQHSVIDFEDLTQVDPVSP